MTTRLKGFVVTLDEDLRDDDAEEIRKAISALRYVVKVAPVEANFDDHINRERIRREMMDRVYMALNNDDAAAKMRRQ